MKEEVFHSDLKVSAFNQDDFKFNMFWGGGFDVFLVSWWTNFI